MVEKIVVQLEIVLGCGRITKLVCLRIWEIGAQLVKRYEIKNKYKYGGETNVGSLNQFDFK